MYTDKYKALAFQSPYGKLLDAKVKQNWNQWLIILDKNNIHRIFCNYGYTHSRESCASDIYAAAIWGYGVSNWLEGQNDPEDYSVKFFFKGHADMNLRRFRGPNNTPLWFYLLDSWLESLWEGLRRDYLSLGQKISDC